MLSRSSSENKSPSLGRERKTTYVLTILLIFASSCRAQNNATLLYADAWPPASNLVWSPDGHEIAVTGVVGNPPISTIHILDINSRMARLLIDQEFGHVHAQSWTPDGEQLGFFGFSNEDSKQGTWLVDTVRIGTPNYFSRDNMLAWSSTGEMAISRIDTQTQEVSLYLTNAIDGAEKVIFIEVGVSIDNASWSSDGSKLVFLFEKNFDRNHRIYIYDKGTTRTTQVIPDGNNRSPSFSPDGKMIAYTMGDPDGISLASYLHVALSDGSCDVEVPGRYDIYSPAWSPDGKWIAFIGKRDGGIYLLDLVGAFGKDITQEGLPCP